MFLNYITYIQAIHKRMVRFQKLTRNLFLTLDGHNVHRQQRQLSKFLMRYQQFASHFYCGASFQDGVAAGKGFLCAPFWGVQICDDSDRRMYPSVHNFYFSDCRLKLHVTLWSSRNVLLQSTVATLQLCIAGYIQAIHKRMVRFQKLTRNLFLTLHGHNVHGQ